MNKATNTPSNPPQLLKSDLRVQLSQGQTKRLNQEKQTQQLLLKKDGNVGANQCHEIIASDSTVSSTPIVPESVVAKTGTEAGQQSTTPQNKKASLLPPPSSSMMNFQANRGYHHGRGRGFGRGGGSGGGGGGGSGGSFYDFETTSLLGPRLSHLARPYDPHLRQTQETRDNFYDKNNRMSNQKLFKHCWPTTSTSLLVATEFL